MTDRVPYSAANAAPRTARITAGSSLVRSTPKLTTDDDPFFVVLPIFDRLAAVPSASADVATSVKSVAGAAGSSGCCFLVASQSSPAFKVTWSSRVRAAKSPA